MLCCSFLLFVVVALPFSASLWLIVHVGKDKKVMGIQGIVIPQMKIGGKGSGKKSLGQTLSFLSSYSQT